MPNLKENINFSANDLRSKVMSKTIVPLHVMAGCDVTSSFFGVGKKTCAEMTPEKYRI